MYGSGVDLYKQNSDEHIQCAIFTKNFSKHKIIARTTLFIKMLRYIKSFFNEGTPRSLLIKKNILLSLFNKIGSVILSFLTISLTIHYINPSRYGIWVTLSSIIIWMTFFDIGLAHGFRNRFAEAKAKGMNNLAQSYVSTTYAILCILFSILFIISSLINSQINWSDILNTDNALDEELRHVFFILISFFCLQMVLNVVSTLSMANQQPAFALTIITFGQLLSLIAIYILTKTTSANLSYLAFVSSGFPCFVLLIASLWVYQTKYKEYAPSWKTVNFKLTKRILSLGNKFFIIQLSTLFMFQFTNIILSRIRGPESVTEYNIAYKYFNVLFITTTLILIPFWSAFTDAYTKKDFTWMKNAYNRLSHLWYISIPVCILMVIISPWIYKIWLQEAVSIAYPLSASMAIYTLIMSRANLYAYLIYGIGKIRLLMYINIFFALILIPLMLFFCRRYGSVGIVIVSTIPYATLLVIGHIQLQKIIRQRAMGLWNK